MTWNGLYGMLFHDISQYMMHLIMRNAKNVRLDRVSSRMNKYPTIYLYRNVLTGLELSSNIDLIYPSITHRRLNSTPDTNSSIPNINFPSIMSIVHITPVVQLSLLRASLRC